MQLVLQPLMTPKLFEDIVEFAFKNKGDTAFMNQSLKDIRENIVEAAMEDRLEFFMVGNEVHGVCIWNVTKFIPMEIHINELVAIHKQSMGYMLKHICAKMPPIFRCFAYRNKGLKKLEYKNPRRIVRLIERNSNVRSLCPSAI
jgi:hypothetical protein